MQSKDSSKLSTHIQLSTNGIADILITVLKKLYFDAFLSNDCWLKIVELIKHVN